MPTNNLNEIMSKEGLANSELARFSNLSDRTISKVKRQKANPSQLTKNKITRGLNENPKKLKNYTAEEIFID